MFSKISLSFVVLMAMAFSLLGGVAPHSVHAQDGIQIPAGTPIALGETVQGELSPEAPIAAYTVEGVAGDAIQAYVEDDTFTAIYLIVANSDGEILYYVSFDPINAYAVRLPIFILPEDGVYSIAVTGSDYFILQETTASAAFSLTVDAVEYQTLSYGDQVEGELSTEHMLDVFVFDASVSDIPYLVLESEGNEILLDSLVDLETGEIEGNQPYGTQSYYISPFYVMDDNTYSVLVYNSELAYAFDDSPTYPYSLNLALYEPLPIGAGETAEVELTVENLLNYLTFEGHAGENASVSLETTVDLTFTTVIFDSDGQPVAYAEYSEPIEEARLPQDGSYTIALFPSDYMIDPEDLSTINVTLTIE